jgi:L-ascorbate metabolism protein UlaG (beta-lactamase superfamily)
VFKSSKGSVVYVDPYLGDACKALYGLERLITPPLAASEVRADYVLATHNHADHLDPDAFPEIAQYNATALFIGPSSCTTAMRELGIPASQTYTLNHDDVLHSGHVRIHATFADHVWGDPDDAPDAVGYMIDFGDVRVYVSGDTLYHERMEGIASLQPHLAFICINGRWGNMTAAEAAHLATVLRAKTAVPTHYNMFANNSADPADFANALAEEGGSVQPLVLTPGQRILYPERDAS